MLFITNESFNNVIRIKYAIPPIAINTAVFNIVGATLNETIYIIPNIISELINGFIEEANIFFIDNSFFTMIIIIIEITASAITVAIAAPIDLNLYINIILSKKLITAPLVRAIVNLLSFFAGNKYCNPKTLLIPIITTSNEQIFNKVMDFS